MGDRKRFREDSSANMDTITKMEDKIKSGKFEIGDILVGIFEILKFNAKTHEKTIEKLDVIKGVSDEVLELRSEMDELKENQIRLETELCSTSLILRNMPYHAQAVNGFERISLTEQQVESFFAEAKIQDIAWLDCRRFAKRTSQHEGTNQKNTPAPVRVKLLSSRHVNLFFGFLNNLQGSDKFKKVGVNRETPPSLMKSWRELQTKAYEIRKNQKLQTRVIQRGLKLVLQTRKDKTDIWKDYKENK